MPRRKISFDVAVNTASAQREASRIAAIFQSRLRNVAVGTTAGGGGAGGGGAGGGTGSRGSNLGMPGSSLENLFKGSAQFAVAGHFYKFFSDLPRNVMMLDTLATANKRAAASFETLAGGAAEANAMVDAYVQGMGGAASRVEATTNSMRLFNIGMASNAEEMRIFTTLSRGMSQALGRDTGYIQEQLSLALANQSLLRFDQLGLSIERHQELMEELTAAHPELTREIIFQNAMLTQATEKYYNLATAQEALASSTELAGVALQDQQAYLAAIVGQKIIQPIAGALAGALGSPALNLNTAALQNYAASERFFARTSIGDESFETGVGFPDVGKWFQDQFNNMSTWFDPVQQELNAATATALVTALNTAQASVNLGIEPNPEYLAFLKEVGDALLNGAPALDNWLGRINAITHDMEMATTEVNPLNSSIIELGDAAAITRAKVDAISDSLIGAAAGMGRRLIEEGVDPTTAREMVPTEARIRATAEELQKSAAMQGDAIDQEMAMAMAEEQLLGRAEDYIENMKEGAAEAERAAKAAASEQERAAKAAEKAFLNAADEIADTFDKMLNKIPGLFGVSEVTEEDLLLAEKGQSVNFADDYRRRVEDVAFNKVERGDVDMGLVRAALGLPEDADDQVAAIMFSRAWESGSLWQNPENIEKFMNVGAARDNLREQEMAALGTQNLRAFFGLGTEQGNEFLRVFGVEALDPIQDGLITEISTRGPIMGETLANAMHEGFKNQSLTLPWVQTLMSAIDSAVGRALLGDLNSGAQGELATAEAIP